MQILEAKENQIQKLEDKVHTVTAKENISFASDALLPSPETFRSAVFEDSLNISLQDETREEVSPAPSGWVPDSVDQCQYWLCEFTSTSASVLNQHILDAHTIDSTFTFPSSSEKTICGYDVGRWSSRPKSWLWPVPWRILLRPYLCHALVHISQDWSWLCPLPQISPWRWWDVQYPSWALHSTLQWPSEMPLQIYILVQCLFVLTVHDL